jgi:hypothetical protein
VEAVDDAVVDYVAVAVDAALEQEELRNNVKYHY